MTGSFINIIVNLYAFVINDIERSHESPLLSGNNLKKL